MTETSKKIQQLPALIQTIESWRAKGLKIVFTNGCFDILHLGHVDYLEKTSELADKCIIGINSDNSISRLKGAERPITNLYARSRILAALGFVDAVVSFEEDTPLQLIKTIMPDVLVKGNDYNIESIVGADVIIESGGKVETVELVEGYSTTNIINKIKDLNI